MRLIIFVPIAFVLFILNSFPAYITISNFTKYHHQIQNFKFSEKNSLYPIFDSPKSPVLSYRFLNKEIKSYQNQNHYIHWSKGIAGQAPEFLGRDSNFKLPYWKNFFKDNSLSRFTISFYFFPKTISESESLIEGQEEIYKIDTIINQVFKVGLEKGNLVWSMENFFHLGKDNLSISLESNIPFKARKWNHAVITYDDKNARLIMYLNGEMVDFAYTTKSGQEYGPIYYPGFLATQDGQFTIGKKFIGMLDEIEVFDDYLGNFPPRFKVANYNKKNIFNSTYISKVFKLETETQIERINFTGSNIDTKQLKLYLCEGRTYFIEKKNPQECNQILWDKRIIDYPEAHFYQFFLVYNNLDQAMKTIDSITLTYQKDKAPLPPRFETLTQIKDGILIEWQETLKSEIAGYKIYYQKNSFKGNKNVILLTKEKLRIYKTPFDRWTYILENLDQDSLYFFAIKAYELVDGRKRESNFSEIKSFYYSSDFFN